MNKSAGYKTLQVADDLITKLEKEGQIEIWDKRYETHPNLYLEMRSITVPKHTALGKINSENTHINILSHKNRQASNITVKNREQYFALDALLDEDISVVALTGLAGSGKTILSLAAAMEKLQKKKYKKVILTRPMSFVGKYSLGALPGEASEKFSPYLLNYTTNLEQFGIPKKNIEDMLAQYRFEIVPPQLIRGASFKDSFVIADELQVFTDQEVLTVGTRIGEGSKLVLLGDLDQRDENIAKTKTGLYKLINSDIAKNSPLIATIELCKCERSETARIFSKIFEE